MRLYFIRHGATRGNKEHRYVGCTDEGILEEEINRIREKGQSLPAMDGIFLSPSLRCRQTAYALFSIFQSQDYKKLNQMQKFYDIFQTKSKIEIVEDFREMDFGAFEYKNYQELNKNPDYQKFIDSKGKTGFPNGESLKEFQFRCKEAFLKCIQKAKENQWETIAFVIHGGTIMAILEAFGYPKKGYYEYQVSNGCGYIVQLEVRQKHSKECIEEYRKEVETRKKHPEKSIEEHRKEVEARKKHPEKSIEEHRKEVEIKEKHPKEYIEEYEKDILLRIKEKIR